MNLPPDKARLLRQYDNEKKWDLICDQVGAGWSMGVQGGDCAAVPVSPTPLCPRQERFQVKSPPHAYIQKLRSFLEPGVTRKVRGWGVWGSLGGFDESGGARLSLALPPEVQEESAGVDQGAARAGDQPEDEPHRVSVGSWGGLWGRREGLWSPGQGCRAAEWGAEFRMGRGVPGGQWGPVISPTQLQGKPEALQELGRFLPRPAGRSRGRMPGRMGRR